MLESIRAEALSYGIQKVVQASSLHSFNETNGRRDACATYGEGSGDLTATVRRCVNLYVLEPDSLLQRQDKSIALHRLCTPQWFAPRSPKQP
jgi:hypothetical protein